MSAKLRQLTRPIGLRGSKPLWYLAAGVLSYALGYAVVTRGQYVHGFWPVALSDIPGVAAAAAVSWRALRAQNWRLPWIWLAGALWVFVAGDLVSPVSAHVGAQEFRVKPTDILYLAGYWGFLVATMLFTRPQWNWRERGWLFDLITALAVVGALAGQYVPLPHGGSHGVSWTVASGYPLLDVGLIVVVVVAISAGSITRQTAILVGALGLIFAADPVVHQVAPNDPLGHLPYVFGYGLLGAFALIGPDSTRAGSRPAQAATGWSSLVLPYAAVVLIVGVATASQRSFDRQSGITAFAFVVVAAVLGRQFYALRSALRRERAQTASYSALVSAIPDLLFQIDAAGVIRDYRSANRDGLGTRPELFVGRSITEVFSEPVARSAMEAMRLVQSTGVGQLFEYSLEDAADNLHNYEARIEAMGPGQFLAVVRDVSEHRKATEEVARLAAIVESSDDAIVGRDMDGRVTSWNAAASRLFGFPAAEVLGMRAESLAAGERPHELEVLLPPVRKGGEVRRADGVRVTASGAEVEISLSAFPVFDRLGVEIGNAAIMRDVTERKLIEAQLLHAQKMEGIGRLAGGIAHDFNNLLTAIVGYAEFARESLDPASAASADIAEVLNASNRARDLTRQLLAFARKQVVQPKVVSLDELVRGTESLLKRMIGEDIDFETVSAPELWPVAVDPGQIEQILINLAVNARDAMPTGGRLRIKTANVLVRAEDQQVDGVRPGEYVSLVVADNGSGMTEEVLEHLFEPFFTTKELGKGTGLGLATCYGIVQQAGGHISVESEPGEGATFRVFFPRVEGAIQPAFIPAPEQRETGGNETILLAEDETVLRHLMTRALELEGYRVIPAANGVEALACLEAAASPVALVLSDMVMPLMNGRDLADRAQAANPATRVILMSGHSDDLLAAQGSLTECDAFLQKPFTMADLARKTREVLDAPQPEAVA